MPSVAREHTQTEVGWLRGVKHDIGMTNVQYCHRNTVYVLYICREVPVLDTMGTHCVFARKREVV